jgi:putative tryptophan/tyrosine transport system substrate-binding protein
VVITRRRMLVALAVAALAPAGGARAQQARRIGVLWPNPPATFEFVREVLRERGYVEGKDIVFDYRWAQDRLDRLPELAAELVASKVDVIVALAPPATVAARKATQTIPIVFVAIGDPLTSGLVANMARPGGNLTGTTRMLTEMSVKHVEFIKQAIPPLSRLAILWNPANSSHRPALQAAETAARSLSLQVRAPAVQTLAEVEAEFAAIDRGRPVAVLFLADPLFFINLRHMAKLAERFRMPAISNFTEFPDFGGLMGYAPNLRDEFRLAAGLVERILKGAAPGELPVQQPTKFDLVINLKSAAALGLKLPRELLLRADRVIE